MTRGRRPMSEEERKAIWIMASEKLPYKDIARILGRPLGTISQTISHGIMNGIIDRRVEREHKRKE